MRAHGITEAGARSRYYRRVRPTGEAIDDIEASLAFVEDKVAAPLAQVIAGGPLTFQRKAALAQLVGLQMLRGPAFFEHRRTIVVPLLGLLPVGVDSSGGRFL